VLYISRSFLTPNGIRRSGSSDAETAHSLGTEHDYRLRRFAVNHQKVEQVISTRLQEPDTMITS
jgi:hypothetical protein